MKILGISAFYHDSAAALIVDGKIVAAAQEERFSRKKHDEAFPAKAVDYCLQEEGIKAKDLDLVAFYEKPILKFDRLLETYLAIAPGGFSSFRRAMPIWLKDKLFSTKRIRENLPGYFKPFIYPSHHESHAASAFFPSPFQEAAILTMDGVGEWATASIGVGRSNKIEILKELHFPHSIGLLYSAFTYFCGFKVNDGEYKLMGLSAYGEPIYVDIIRKNLIHIFEDGSVWLDQSYFNYMGGLTMTSNKFNSIFGGVPRKENDPITKREMDLAASIQAVTEEIMLKMCVHVKKITGMKHLCLAGGVALNCVGNGKILEKNLFKEIWIQPAAGDAGGALGGALFVWHQLLEKPRKTGMGDSMKGSFLGPAINNHAIEKFLTSAKAVFKKSKDETELCNEVSEYLKSGKVVGWINGRMEFGPRALGARSILGDARSEKMQEQMNLKIKFRESFRPFAPAVLEEKVCDWFSIKPGTKSPYMLIVSRVLEKHCLKETKPQKHNLNLVKNKRSTIPAVTHVDYSARIQTVSGETSLGKLLKEFQKTTNVPILINTSFNLSWEPIVCSVADAYHSFMQSELDVLALNEYLLIKENQPLGFRNQNTDSDAKLNNRIPWVDPMDGQPLQVEENKMVNKRNGNTYLIENGIPQLFVECNNDFQNKINVTEKVKLFYEKTPFPNYEEIDTVRTLQEKARQGLFAKLLNDQIPYQAKVLEVGCGTGQLTNYLALAHRSVLGIDACVNSLRLGQKFKNEHNIKRSSFAQMNLFRPALQENTFDFVISNGVLHHTSNPKAAFLEITKLVRNKGFILVGLYNFYSRVFHNFRRAIYQTTGFLSPILDPHLAKIKSNNKYKAWFEDQYCHPHEMTHSLDEVFQWLDEVGFEFINAIPKPIGGVDLEQNELLFAPKAKGSKIGRLVNQITSFKNAYYEGGFFIIIAQKR